MKGSRVFGALLLALWLVIAILAVQLGADYYQNLVRIDPDSITYRNGGPTETLPNDYTFIFAGGKLPTKFLRDCGVEIETRFGKPGGG